jgi:hypothetical protein
VRDEAMKTVKPGIVGSTGKVAFADFIERGQRARAAINRVNSPASRADRW